MKTKRKTSYPVRIYSGAELNNFFDLDKKETIKLKKQNIIKK